MALEIRGVRKPKLAGLDIAVGVPATVDFRDEVDVCDVESQVLEGGRRDRMHGESSAVAGGEVREEDRKARVLGMVIGEMHEPLACHAFPFAEAGEALGGGAAPEEGFLFLGERGVVVGVRGVGGGRVDGFVDVVPGGGVADVGVAVCFGLGEDGVEGAGGLEGGGGEVEAVEVGEVGLVAGGGGEGPVGEEDAGGVGGEAGGAEGAGVPEMGAAGGGGGRTGDGSVGVKGGEEGLVGEGRSRVVDIARGGVVPAGSSVFAEFVQDYAF